MKTVILFDLYGVLKPDPYESWLNAHHLKRAGYYQELSHQLDTQQMSQTDFFSALASFSGSTVDEISDFFNTTSIVPPETYEALTQLQTQYRLGLISNGSIHTRHMLETTHLADYFEAIIISAEVSVTKPNATIYQKALDALNIKPDDALFIDDNPFNVEAARRYGIEAIQFTSFMRIMQELRKAAH